LGVWKKEDFWSGWLTGSGEREPLGLLVKLKWKSMFGILISCIYKIMIQEANRRGGFGGLMKGSQPIKIN